jgi:hypothetical protein
MSEAKTRNELAQAATTLVNDRLAEAITILREMRPISTNGIFRDPQMIVDNVGAAKWKLEHVMNTLCPLLHKWPKDEDYR